MESRCVQLGLRIKNTFGCCELWAVVRWLVLVLTQMKRAFVLSNCIDPWACIVRLSVSSTTAIHFSSELKQREKWCDFSARNWGQVLVHSFRNGPPSLPPSLIPLLEAKESIFCNLWLCFILMIHKFCSRRWEASALKSQRCLVFRSCSGKGEVLKAPFDE